MKPFFRDKKMKIGQNFKQLSCKITKFWLKIVCVDRDVLVGEWSSLFRLFIHYHFKKWHTPLWHCLKDVYVHIRHYALTHLNLK